MSYRNRNDHPDVNTSEIVKALRRKGYAVWYSGKPADLTVCAGDTLLLLEVKNPGHPTRLQPDQQQLRDLAPWNFRTVYTAKQALRFCEPFAEAVSTDESSEQ